jgi:hypothetical protein
MAKALNLFCKLNNSLRPTILLNCNELSTRFNDEDMKTVDYYELDKDTNLDKIFLRSFKNNCNLFVNHTVEFAEKKVNILYIVLNNLKKYEPHYVVLIGKDELLNNFLNKHEYEFLQNIYSLQIYKKNK